MVVQYCTKSVLMSGFNQRNIIIETLRQHPEGLTISSIAELTGLHRHTSRKYINELTRVGEIIQRSVGVAKLCYLKETNGENKFLEKKSFFQRFNLKLIFSVVLITFLLSEASILAYESSPLNETFIENASNTSPLTSSIILNESNVTQIIDTVIKNSSNSSVDIDTNDSLIPVVISNENPPMVSKFNINFEYPSKITRGEEFTVKAYVSNIASSSAKNIVIEWKLPEGFEITSKTENCETLEPSGSCVSDVTVKSSLSTALGKNDVKIVINYEE